MNGWTLTKRVADSLNAATFSAAPNAAAKADPFRLVEDFEADGTFITTVTWRGRKTENQTKTSQIRMHTIDVAVQRRCSDSANLFDDTKFSGLHDLANEIEEHLISASIAGMKRMRTFVGTDVPFLDRHLNEHQIGTVVITAEYEEQL